MATKASARPRSALLAVETAFGDLSTDNNLPPFSTGFGSAIVPPLKKAELVTYGEQPVVERDDVSGGIGTFYADVVTVQDEEGNPVLHREGDLSVSATLEGYGSADTDTAWLTRFLASAMKDHGEPASLGDTITGQGDAQEATVADEADYQIGGLIQKITNGAKAEYASVISTAAGEITYSPAFSADLDTDDEIRLSRVFSATYNQADLGESLRWRVDGHQWREYVAGSRLKTLSLSSDNRTVVGSFGFTAPHVQSAHDEVVAITSGLNVERRPQRTGGKVLMSANCEVVLSEPVLSTATNWPRLSRAHVLCPAEWSVEIDYGMEPFECPSSILPDDYQPNPTITVNLTLSQPIQELDRDFVDGVYRSLVLGFGPAGAGQGAAIYIPKARMTADPSMRDLGGDKVRQVLTFTSAPDYDGETSSDAGNTAFRIGLTV